MTTPALPLSLDLESMRAVVEQAPDAVILTDPTGAVRIWNQRAVEIFGYSMREAVDGGLDLIIPAELRTAHGRGFGEAMTTGKCKTRGRAVLTRAMHKDGHKVYVELSFSLITEGAGRIMGALAIARDVTQRRLEAAASLKPKADS